MNKVIVVFQEKGGPGKTTIVTNLAICDIMDGCNSFIIDADPQASATIFRRERQNYPKLPPLKGTQITLDTIHNDITQYAHYDTVYIDVGGFDSDVFDSALLSATHVIVPFVPSLFDEKRTEETFKKVFKVKSMKEKRGLEMQVGFLFNKIKKNTNLHKEGKYFLYIFHSFLNEILQEIAEIYNEDRTSGDIVKIMMEGRYKNNLSWEDAKEAVAAYMYFVKKELRAFKLRENKPSMLDVVSSVNDKIQRKTTFDFEIFDTTLSNSNGYSECTYYGQGVIEYEGISESVKNEMIMLNREVKTW